MAKGIRLDLETIRQEALALGFVFNDDVVYKDLHHPMPGKWKTCGHVSTVAWGNLRYGMGCGECKRALIVCEIDGCPEIVHNATLKGQRGNAHFREFGFMCARHRHQLRMHGLLASRFNEMFRQQRGLCAFCFIELDVTKNKGLAIHHDHDCCGNVKQGHGCGTCVRALLCFPCNLGFGFFREAPEVLDRAAAFARADSALKLAHIELAA